jgi:hypothetical protein
MTAKPSLGRFVLERLDREIELVLMNTPVFIPDDWRMDEELRALLSNRDALLERLQGLKDIINRTMEAMVAEQRIAPLPGDGPAPVTALGSFILKRLASRYEDHPDYDPAWQPETD